MTTERVVKAIGLGVRGAALALAVASPAVAQMATPACASISDANLPADLKAWAGARAPLAAAGSAAAALPELAVGTPAAVRLHPTASVRFARPPEQQRTPENHHAGLVRLTLPTAGVWRLSFSKPLWVDVIRGDAALKSGAHGMLAPCTSLRKVVEFAAEAGSHLVQLSGNPGPEVIMMVTRKP